MKRTLAFLIFIVALLLIGCGGGGGGGGGTTGGGSAVTLVGRVLDVTTGAQPATLPSVETKTQSVKTAADGSFTVTGPAGTTSVLIDSLNADGVFTYTFPAANGTIDLGDLWIGPERLSVTGRVVDSTNGVVIGSGTVTFAGRTARVAANGKFNLSQVAYSSTNRAAFLGIIGAVNVTDYFLLNFTAGSATPVAGVLNLGDLLVTPSNDPNPPGLPYSITGVVKPLGTSAGTVVTLREAGVAIRIFNVGADGKYSFWTGPGSYMITYVKGSLTAPSQTVTVQNQGDTVTVPDVTLH